jgi:hypothetical protein
VPETIRPVIGSVNERVMRSRGGWWLAGLLFAVVLSQADPRAFAADPTAPMTVKWSTVALVHIALTPNYTSGFGQIPALIGTQPAPTHGPDAVLNGGSVDFGNVLAGKNYLYKYAAHLHVTSTSPTGVNVYGEGAANFFNTADSTTIPISQAVYFLKSTSGSPADSNTGFSPGTPFLLTSGMVTGGGQFSAPSIN